MKLAVVLFNLGGPDSLDAVEPFLRNLFSDPAIISVPGIFRAPSCPVDRRAPCAGGARDLRANGRALADSGETEAQAARSGEPPGGEQAIEAKCFIAMRCWHPIQRRSRGER